MQQRAEKLDDALIRELLELRAERVHLCKTSSCAQVQEQCDGVGEEPGVVTSTAKVNRCSGDKLATSYTCIATSSLTSHPFLAHSVADAIKMRAERTHLHNLRNCAKAEECDGEIKEYEVATSSAKAQRCSQVKLATTYACDAAVALSSHPSPAVLTPVSILRTTKTVFPQHAIVETCFKLSQAYETHERALSRETSPRAWLAKVRAIEIENGLIPVPAYSGLSVGLRGARLNELLQLRAEKKMSSWNISVTTPLECSSDDDISNILHQPLCIHLIPAGTTLINSPFTTRYPLSTTQ